MKNRKEYYLLIKLYEKFVLHISSGGFDVKVNTIIMVKVKKYIKPFQFERNDAKYCRTRKQCPNLINLSRGLNLPKTGFNRAPA